MSNVFCFLLVSTRLGGAIQFVLPIRVYWKHGSSRKQRLLQGIRRASGFGANNRGIEHHTIVHAVRGHELFCPGWRDGRCFRGSMGDGGWRANTFPCVHGGRARWWNSWKLPRRWFLVCLWCEVHSSTMVAPCALWILMKWTRMFSNKAK